MCLFILIGLIYKGTKGLEKELESEESQQNRLGYCFFLSILKRFQDGNPLFLDV